MSDIFLPGFLKQEAVWWPRIGTDGAGDPDYGGPQQIKCRWDDIQLEIISPNQERFISNAKILVDRDMRQGDRIRLGSLESVPNPNDATSDLNQTYEIKFWQKSPAPTSPDKFVRVVTV